MIVFCSPSERSSICFKISRVMRVFALLGGMSEVASDPSLAFLTKSWQSSHDVATESTSLFASVYLWSALGPCQRYFRKVTHGARQISHFMVFLPRPTSCIRSASSSASPSRLSSTAGLLSRADASVEIEAVTSEG